MAAAKKHRFWWPQGELWLHSSIATETFEVRSDMHSLCRLLGIKDDAFVDHSASVQIERSVRAGCWCMLCGFL